MDKNAIKKYAVWARRELISRVSQRAALYEITADGYGDQNAASVHGTIMSTEEKKQRIALIDQIKVKGYEQVMEEIAYTWFNRFSALRFMEVNGYLPTRVRVFTDDENNFKPQILTEAINMEIDDLDMQTVYDLKNANNDDALFKYMIIVQCNALSKILPGMFQRISDYTELLFPDNLLREGSVVEQMIAIIPQEDWTDQVQIIGWLYQYYNSEPKDQVFANLKKNIKISKENIPAATQLFTPDWIVRYMVENSLGRLWLEGHPNDDLKSEWKYYLTEAEQEPEVQTHLTEIRKEYAALKPEDILAIDPCQGSGHILAYMFDVLVQIYESYGYSAREAASNIVEHNIWGLDIDERATQLAYFSIMMKARQYDRRFFNRGIQPHVYAIQESNNLDSHCVEYFVDGRKELQFAMDTLVNELRDAKEYGSLLNVSQVDFDALYSRFDEFRNEAEPSIYSYQIMELLLPFVQMSQALAQKYHVVITNPPYMANSGMSGHLSEYIKKNYSKYKADLYSAFIAKCNYMTLSHGMFGMMTSYTWMFLSSFEDTRRIVEINNSIMSLIQPEYHAFFESAYVPICTFTVISGLEGVAGRYIQLKDFYGADIQNQKVLEAVSNPNCGYLFTASAKDFLKIEGAPIAYWVGKNLIKAFDNPCIGDIAKPKQGLATGKNDLFTRLWFEVDKVNISFDASSREIALSTGKKWFPYNKGGEYRKWYGNNDFIVNWDNDGYEIRNYKDEKGKLKSRPQNMDYYFQPSVTWSKISSGNIAFRYKPRGHIFDVAGASIFTNDGLRFYVLGFCNSSVALKIAQMISPTLNYEVGHIASFPVIVDKDRKEEIEHLVSKAIDISKRDWDSFELSWDFKRHPLIKFNSKLEDAYNYWSEICDNRFKELKSIEERINEIFIEIYGLTNEMSKDVAEKDVTVRKANRSRDIRSLISYAVGCIFGRYSLDNPGIIYTGGSFDAEKYHIFTVDKDNIIPICDDEYFPDDIVNKFEEFVKTVYGSNNLQENMRYIADSLEGSGQPKEKIRNYFINDFYSDHCSMCAVSASGKRPIYWLFDSGKKNGFKCLIYMHRYQPDTIARIRTDYIHEQQSRYRTAIVDLETRMANSETSERVKLTRRLHDIKAQAEELRVYEEKIHHLADQMICINLDDGVKVNYAKFQEVLAKIR